MPTGVTTDSVDYLQRMSVAPSLEVPFTVGDPDARRILRIRGVGRSDRDPRRPQPRELEEPWRARTADLITGLYGHRVPLAFEIDGTPAGVRVRLGTWSSTAPPTETQDRRRDVLAAVLAGLYSSTSAEEEPATVSSPLPAGPMHGGAPLGGFALGVPDPTGIQEQDGSAPIDRIIAALSGTTWSMLVLAHPLSEHGVARVRQQVLNELRAIATEAEAEGAPSPLAEHYVDLLKATLTHLGDGLATGAWRTGVYLLGDDQSYPRLAAAWRSVFSGVRSLPEPVRVHDLPEAVDLAQDWALPDQPGEPGPGLYRRPFELQSLLTTTQLAAYAHLPELETPGFMVETVARFDTAPADGRADGLPVGRIVQRGRELASEYRVSLASLTRHAFVAGVTGSGKSNTVLSLLAAADRAQVPFLVVEPTKTEYRALLAHPTIGPRLRVFTAGKLASPLLLNPFEVPTGTAVSEHLDLVRAAFTAAFGMWTPLPQILERCLHEVYTDRGWDLRTNENSRLRPGDETALAYPTLADLTAKVKDVIPTLGYEDRIAGDMRAALVTRLEGLRAGGKGAMLDVVRSLPCEELFGQPTVLELEALGDDGDKAFLAALILIRLAEYRRAQGQRPSLAHLLVIEEAHRLLANVQPTTSEESADPRGKAVETFSNLLSEIRAYGQGVIAADQIPVQLAAGVMKNTDLKIAHRIVSADDREAMGRAMVMDDDQIRALATLGVGEAAVFSTGEDAPMLVRIPLVKDRLTTTWPADGDVARHMAGWRQDAAMATLFLPRSFCADTCADAPEACAAARRMTGDDYVQRTIARVVLATIEESGALDRLWGDLAAVVSARRPPEMGEHELLRAVAGHGADWYAERRGAQGAWTYADTAQVEELLREMLLDKVDGGAGAATARRRAAFQAAARRLHQRTFAPYPVCEMVCAQDPPLCLYRSAVADVVASGRYQQSWLGADTADSADAGPCGPRRKQTWDVCQDAAYEITEFPEENLPAQLADDIVASAKRVCLCFEQQMLAADPRKSPRTARRILARVLTESSI
ncbi:ATPase [Pseudofrankia sp. EUN1h]|nr:ATPase [Pseudofrankia sp. EUN1h]